MDIARTYLAAGTVCIVAAGALAQPALRANPAPKADPTAPTAPAPTTAPGFDPVWRPVHDAVARYVREAELPGASVLVIQDGQEKYREYFGRYTAATEVPIASASKWLTGATIMALVDEGLIDLDKPIGQYLPAFKDDKAAITVRQLMSHTSGLPGESRIAGGVRKSLADEVDAIAAAPLAAKPGAVFAYGGESMQVAGRIAEVVTGKSWRDIFQAKIAGPLNLTHTHYGRLGLNPNPQLAGGASSTLDDYARFLRMIAGKGEVDGVRVLSEAAVRTMCADQTKGADGSRSPLVKRLDGAKYGIGNWVNELDSSGAGTVNSSPGAFGFTPWVDRERHVVGVFMIAEFDLMAPRAGRQAMMLDIRKQINSALGPAPAPSSTPKTPGGK